MVDNRTDEIAKRLGCSPRIEKISADIGTAKLSLLDVSVGSVEVSSPQCNIINCYIDKLSLIHGRSVIYITKSTIELLELSKAGGIEMYPDSESRVKYVLGQRSIAGISRIYIPKDMEYVIGDAVKVVGEYIVSAKTNAITNTSPLRTLKELCMNVIGLNHTSTTDLPTDITEGRTLTCGICNLTTFKCGFKAVGLDVITTECTQSNCNGVDMIRLRLSAKPRKGYKVTELKLMCRRAGIKIGRKKKAQLVDALLAYYQ